MTLELSVRAESGVGSTWSVDVMNTSEHGEWETIGDFSLVPTGGGWTPISMTVTDTDFTKYLDPSCDDEILIRMYSESKWQVRSFPAVQCDVLRSSLA